MSTLQPIDVRALPYRVRMIAEKLGISKTFELLTEHGAQCFTIPPCFSPTCALAQNLGDDAAKVLIELWPDKALDLPKVDKILLQWRDAELLTDIVQNELSIMKAVKKYNITRQRINQILNAHGNPQNKNPTLELDLFS